MTENTITVEGHLVEVREVAEDGRIRFKLDNTWRDPDDWFVPNCTALEFLMRLHRIGGEACGFWSKEMPKGRASNAELRRWVTDALRINGRVMNPKDTLDFPVYSVVLFPKGNRITIY